MQGDRQFAGGDFLARHFIGIGQHFIDEGNAGFRGLAGAADFLDLHFAQAPGELLLLHQAADLVDLAAEAEHHHMGEVHVARVAAERAPQQCERFVLRHAAAGLVGERNDAVDIGIVGERIVPGEGILLEHVGDHAGHMGAAIHRGEDADIVARRDAAVAAPEAHESRRQIEIRRRLDVHAIGVVAVEIAHAAILGVDVLARRNRLRREADDLAVAADLFAGRDGADGDLVAGGNALAGHHAFRHLDTGQQRGARDQYSVVVMQTNDGRWSHRNFLARVFCCLE